MNASAGASCTTLREASYARKAPSLLSGAVIEYPSIGALLFLAVGGNPPNGSSAAIGIGFQAIFLLLMLGLVASRLRAVLQVVSKMWPLALAVLVTIASSLWSQDSLLSLRMGLAFAVVSLFGVYLAVRFPPEQLMEIVLSTGLIAGLLGLAASIFVPSVGLDSYNAGAWQGIFGAKNNCAANMLFFTAPLLASPGLFRKRPVRNGVLVLVAALLTFKADSKMALLLLAFSLVLMWCIKRIRHFHPKTAMLLRLLVLLGGVAALMLLYVSVPALLAVLGKGSNLGARVPIWKAVAEPIRDRLLFGYGYQAFWRAEDGLLEMTTKSIGFRISNAQNGWLDVLLQVGVIGLVPTIFIFVKFAHDLVRIPAELRGEWRDWAIFVFALILAYQLDESMLLNLYNLPWFFTIMVCTLAHLKSHEGMGPLVVRRRQSWASRYVGLNAAWTGDQ